MLLVQRMEALKKEAHFSCFFTSFSLCFRYVVLFRDFP
ncbi:hypothetical protein B4168_3856 [Anoxybacillus flavithermus]|nr:hypothetical protein B4168_3856 [Anoxybacillus flavithermus]OAO87960.1 hypothetical protein GT23_0693 [Parageobacillus thermoglucosidasius]